MPMKRELRAIPYLSFEDCYRYLFEATSVTHPDHIGYARKTVNGFTDLEFNDWNEYVQWRKAGRS